MLQYTTEIDILNKYKDLFPDSFLKCIQQGCTWLAVHNNITYQTTTMVRTDANIYVNSGSTALRIGIIDTDQPLAGLNFYDVLAVGESVDNITGNTVFNIKARYKTPMGIEFTLIPIKYYTPNEVIDYYLKSEIDTKLDELNNKIKEITTAAGNPITKEDITNTLSDYVTLETFKTIQTAVNDCVTTETFKTIQNGLNQKADIEITNELRKDVGVLQTKTNNYEDLVTKDTLDNYYTKTTVDEKITTAITGGQVDLSSYATKDELNTKADSNNVFTKQEIQDTYLTKEQGNTLATTTQVEEAKTELSQQLSNNLKNVLTRKAHATGFFFNGGDELTKDNKLYIVKTAFMATDNFENDKVNLVEVIDNLSSIANKADKTELDTYATKEYVTQAIAGASTGDVDLSAYLTTENADNKYLDKATYTTDKDTLATKEEVNNLDNKFATTTKVEELQNTLNTKADTSTLDTYATQEFVTTKVKEVQASAVNKDEVVEALKADEAFKTSVKGDVGPAGKDGTSVSADEIKDSIVTTLKADKDFLNATKGERGETGLQGEVGQTGPAGKDGVNPSVSDILSNEAFTNEVYKKTEVDSTFLKQADATTTYLSKNDATKTYLTKDEASNTYQPKANQ